MADPFDQLSDQALLEYLRGEANERGQRLVVEQRDGRWFAEIRAASGLSDDEVVVLGASGPDRRTAMVSLAHELTE
jgi:hypothetical protein